MITMTRNDDCRFTQWVEHFQEYKDALYLHIIVDNDSSLDYQAKLKKYFPNSVILELGFNGGCTYAYNAGIKYALADKKVDAISLMANDIKISADAIKSLYEFLISDSNYGMVFPRVQNPAVGSEVINSFGNAVDKFTMRMLDLHHGEKVADMPDYALCETGPGGCNMASRRFYELVGLQDEKLFMYSDEVDTGIKARKKDVLLAVTKNVEAWHLHINEGNGKYRSNFASYLSCRNKVYLAKKHYGQLKALFVWFFFLLDNLRLIIKYIRDKEARLYYFYGIKGACAGLINNMDNLSITTR